MLLKVTKCRNIVMINIHIMECFMIISIYHLYLEPESRGMTNIPIKVTCPRKGTWG